jgi:hypothetical protein
MNQLPMEMTENGIHYTLHGDYYFPDLMLPEAAGQTIGHYGRMRKAYLEEHRPGLYERLLLSGRLYDHLAEIDRSCAARLEAMITGMAAAEGVDEALKARDQMAWVARMNNIRHRAEESILAELVFD